MGHLDDWPSDCMHEISANQVAFASMIEKLSPRYLSLLVSANCFRLAHSLAYFTDFFEGGVYVQTELSIPFIYISIAVLLALCTVTLFAVG